MSIFKRKKKTAPSQATTPDPYEIGAVMKDGTIYGGISPTTHKPMFVAPKSSEKTMAFKQAAAYASTLEVGGHKDFRVPTMAELRVLFANRDKGALKGTFNAASKPKDAKEAKIAKNYYWSSTPVYSGQVQWNQRIGCNILHDKMRDNNALVRCVR
jgi:hypothetical protein